MVRCSISGASVLIVEDDIEFREVSQRSFKRNAESSREALRTKAGLSPLERLMQQNTDFFAEGKEYLKPQTFVATLASSAKVQDAAISWFPRR